MQWPWLSLCQTQIATKKIYFGYVTTLAAKSNHQNAVQCQKQLEERVKPEWVYLFIYKCWKKWQRKGDVTSANPVHKLRCTLSVYTHKYWTETGIHCHACNKAHNTAKTRLEDGWGGHGLWVLDIFCLASELTGAQSNCWGRKKTERTTDPRKKKSSGLETEKFPYWLVHTSFQMFALRRFITAT